MTRPPARILHVAHNILPHVGGLEAVVAAETRGLSARGYDVTVVGSTSSAPGEATGVGRPEGVPTLPVTEAARAVWRPFADLEEGEARRERMLRKADLRFGGRAGAGWMGRWGRATAGWASWSFVLSSMISREVRLRVRLWVGAGA